jgi:hypothetical protein
VDLQSHVEINYTLQGHPSISGGSNEARPGSSRARSAILHGWHTMVISLRLSAWGKEEKGKPSLGLHGSDLGLWTRDHRVAWSLPGVGDNHCGWSWSY